MHRLKPGTELGVSIRGQDGYSVLNGSGSPSTSLGRDNDFYIDTDVMYIYGPKSAGLWGTGVPMTATLDIHALTTKDALVDNDELILADSESSYANKKTTKQNLFTKIKTYLDSFFVPLTRTVNTKALSSNITLTQDDIGDGTTNKQYSSTEKSKLSGIEASADVTDLTNVSSSINGASAVTPVDADKFPFIDNDDATIKTVTGANLKTYIGTGSGDITKDELAGGSLVTTIADTEHIPISVAGSPNSIKKIVWTAFKTILDGIYALAGHSHNYLVPTGGTTDQVLAKNSNTNGDLKWATVSGGSFDIHALTATTTLTSADEFPLYDDSASAQRKATWETIWKHLFPVGSIVCFDNTTSDPNTIYGGTWSRVGDGKFPVGYDSGDTDFDTALETGGSKTNDISHTHPISPTTKVYTAGALSVQSSPVATNTGGSTTLKILPPYIVFCYWRRTA